MGMALKVDCTTQASKRGSPLSTVSAWSGSVYDSSSTRCPSSARRRCRPSTSTRPRAMLMERRSSSTDLTLVDAVAPVAEALARSVSPSTVAAAGIRDPAPRK